MEDTILGRPRWHITLVIVFISQFVSAFAFSLVFPFTPLYVETLGSTLGMDLTLMAGLAISAQAFTMMLTAPLWGVVADRYGRKLMAMRAMFGGLIIMSLMAFVASAEQLVILRAIQGCITGTLAANNAIVAAETPRKHIGFAMGFTQIGLWAGVAVGPIVGGLLSDYFGFAVPFLFTGALLGLSGMLILVGIRETFVPVKTDPDKPQVNLGASVLAQWRHVLFAPGVSLVYLLIFLAGIGRTMIIPVAPLFVVSLIPDVTHQSLYAGLVMSVSSASATISGVMLGRLGDKIGHQKVYFWSAVAITFAYIPQVIVMDVYQLLFLQALAGIAVGGLIAAPSALLARYTQPGEEGVVYGLDNSISSGSRAIAPLVGSGIAVVLGLRGTFAASAILFALVALTAYRFLPKAKQQTSAPVPLPAVGD